MSWDFFRTYRGARSGGSAFPIPPGSDDDDFPDGVGEPSQTELEYETRARGMDWRPLDAAAAEEASEWPNRPLRYVDGKEVGRTVAWLRSPQGYPVAVRLAQIGAVVMREEGRQLVREWQVVEKVISMDANLFAWDQIEALARTLREDGFRLLIAGTPHKDGQEIGPTFECEPMWRAAKNTCTSEMGQLERLALSQRLAAPTLVDGRLDPRSGAFDLSDPVVGLIKTHAEPYFGSHRDAWQVLYDLSPGQRTPAFTIQPRTEEGGPHGLRVVSFYVRIADGAGGETPTHGIVRVELAHRHFEQVLGQDWSELDRLAGFVRLVRCHDDTYGRAAISIQPIVRAEESLGSLFADADGLISRFYARTGM